MFIRPCYGNKDGKRHAYWALVESYRSQRGPRQRVVAYLGQLDEKGRLGIKGAAEGRRGRGQRSLFEQTEPEWVEVDAARVRVESCRDFGGPWLGLELVRTLGLDQFLDRTIPAGREDVPWPTMALVLVLARLCNPSTELHIAEHFYGQSALPDLLGVAERQVNDDRLYRALDALLPHKEALERFLKERLGTLFDLEYDLLLYDVTSTYFEGEAKVNAQAQRGYSRDHRADCKQVCIGLVVSRDGMPLGYEVFAGNRADVTTLQEIVETMEGRYGRARRIWVLDRGMISEENIGFLKEGGRSYIVGTPRGMLKRFEQELLKEDWESVREGLEVKLCASAHGEETFILCRSADRREKEKAIHARFEERIEKGLEQTRLRRAPVRRRNGSQARGQAPGEEQPGGRPVSDRPKGRPGGRSGDGGLAEGGSVAGLGHLERRVLPAQEQPERLERPGPMAGLHPAHRSGVGVSYSQERPADQADLASEGEARTGAHPGLLPGLRAVEDAGRAMPLGGSGRRAASGLRGTLHDQDR